MAEYHARTPVQTFSTLRRNSAGTVLAETRPFSNQESQQQPLDLEDAGLTANEIAELQRQMAEENEQYQQQPDERRLNQHPASSARAEPETPAETHVPLLSERLQSLRSTVMSLPESVRANLIRDYPISEAEKEELRAACGIPSRNPPPS